MLGFKAVTGCWFRGPDPATQKILKVEQEFYILKFESKHDKCPVSILKKC